MFTPSSASCNPDGSRKEKLPKSATEPWFKQKESDDITGAGSLDLILVLRGELEKARMQLKFIKENYSGN